MKELKSAFDNVAISENENSGALNAFGGIVSFVTDHMEGLVEIIIYGTGAYAAYWAYTKLATIAIWAQNEAQLFSALVQGKNVMAFAKGTLAMKAFTIWQGLATIGTWLATTATTAFSAALQTTGIPLIIIGIAALIAGIILLVKNWDKVTIAMKKFGKFILSGVLYPITLVLDAIGKMTGAKWAINASASIKSLISNSPEKIVGKTLPGKELAGKALPKKELAGKALPSNLIGGTNVNYSPNITIGGTATEADKKTFADMLKQNKRDVISMIDEHKNNKARFSFEH